MEKLLSSLYFTLTMPFWIILFIAFEFNLVKMEKVIKFIVEIFFRVFFLDGDAFEEVYSVVKTTYLNEENAKKKP